jgi:hypothetical protein
LLAARGWLAEAERANPAAIWEAFEGFVNAARAAKLRR